MDNINFENNHKKVPCLDCGKSKDVLIKGFGICSQCADDRLEANTGCRFGTPETCHHPDCDAWRMTHVLTIIHKRGKS